MNLVVDSEVVSRKRKGIPMKESFRQWANKSGGNPIAFSNLMNYPVNLAGFIIMALWNTLESMNLLFPKSITILLVVNIIFDVLLNVYLFCHILRTNPFKQQKYLFAIIAWNMMDVGFNFLMVVPNAFIWVMSIRCILDVLINAGIVILCYRKPEKHDFVPVIDQVLGYNEGVADTINTTYVPSKSKKGFSAPPNSIIVPVKELQQEVNADTSLAEVKVVGEVSDVYHYQFLDKMCKCWDLWTVEGEITSEKEALLSEVQGMATSFPEYGIALKDLCDQVERVRGGMVWNLMPSSMKTIKEQKERYASMI